MPPHMPHLRPYQAKVLQSLIHGFAQRPGATFTVMFPRQAGKNEVSAALVSYLLLTNAAKGGTVIVCAPTLYPQASISLERTAASLGREVIPAGGRVVRRDNVLQSGNARAIFLSASREAHVAGHTASLALIADEAQDVDEDWFNRQFRPMAASTGAPALLFGTPWNGDSLLEHTVERNRRLDRSGGRQLPLHHEAHWHEVASLVPPYGDYVRQERERLGPNHPLFVTQYELRSIREAGRLFNEAQLRRLAGDHEPLDGPRAGERYVAGLDFGGDGAHADATVLAVGRVADGSAEVVRLYTWQGLAYDAMLEAVAGELSRWNPLLVCADATGLGGPLVDALARRLRCAVEHVVFSAGTKSSLGFGLLAAVETGRFRLHRDDGSAVYRDCLQQLRDCEARPVAGAALRWGNDRGHDDIVVALALCVRAASAAGPPRIAAGRRR